MKIRRMKTWRWAVAVVALAAVTGCGRPGPSDDGKPVEIDGRKTDLGRLRKESEQAEKAALKGDRALAAMAGKDLLPASVDGYARTNVQIQPGADPGVTRTTARYVKGAMAFVLELVDDGASGAIGVNPANVGAASTRRTATGYETVSTAGGRTTTEQWDTAQRAGRYAVVAAERFSISATGSAEDVSVLKAAVETVNAARLRALAPTG